MENDDFHTLFTVASQSWSLLQKSDFRVPLNISTYFIQSCFIFWENTKCLQKSGLGVQYPLNWTTVAPLNWSLEVVANFSKLRTIKYFDGQPEMFYLVVRWTTTMFLYFYTDLKCPKWLPNLVRRIPYRSAWYWLKFISGQPEVNLLEMPIKLNSVRH